MVLVQGIAAPTVQADLKGIIAVLVRVTVRLKRTRVVPIPLPFAQQVWQVHQQATHAAQVANPEHRVLVRLHALPQLEISPGAVRRILALLTVADRPVVPILAARAGALQLTLLVRRIIETIRVPLAIFALSQAPFRMHCARQLRGRVLIVLMDTVVRKQARRTVIIVV